MALKIKTVRFLLERISHSTYKDYLNALKQLFFYLKGNIKDNPIYDEYVLYYENNKDTLPMN